MNYQKIYDNIIEKAKSETRVKCNEIYYENHHILPRCLGGGEEKENKVLLTAKEHYVCHKLLIYIYPHNRGIILAFHRMVYSKNHGYIVSGRDYKYIKELFGSIPMSLEQRKKITKTLTGIKQSKETIEKRMKKLRGRKRKLSKEMMKKMHIRNILNKHNQGENNPMFGKNHSSNSIILMRKAKLKKYNIILTSENILEIKRLYKVIKYEIIAKMYKISYNTVRHIFDGRYDWLVEIEQISREK